MIWFTWPFYFMWAIIVLTYEMLIFTFHLIMLPIVFLMGLLGDDRR